MSAATPPPPPLSPRRLFLLLIAFFATAVLAHVTARWAQQVSPAPLGIGRWFPVAYGHPRVPSGAQLLAAGLGIAAFAGAVRSLPRLPEKRRYAAAALIGFLSIVASTAIQGTGRGFVHPVAGREPRAKPAQYWHDAEAQAVVSSADAMRFLRDYRAIQPTLAEHGRTHPPGAVLLFALLRRASGDRPAPAAVTLCLLSVVLAAIGFRRAGAPPSALLLFCALPAVQVYYCATLDAVIAGLLFLTIVGVAGSPPAPNAGGEVSRPSGPAVKRIAAGSALTPPALGAGGLLPFLAASFLTFGVVWAVPVLLAAEAARTRRFPVRAAAVLLATGLFYVLLFFLTGFDYFAAFRSASLNENPDGFRLLASPIEYFSTRVENVADLLFFAGPLVLWAAWRGLPVARREAFGEWVMLLAGVASLILLFLAGAYRTGETARACLFLYPLLILVAARAPLPEQGRETLIVATFGVSVLLQCAGFYFW